MQFRDYYEILGVERNASQADIKKAFRQKSRQYHPDVNQASGSEDKFKQVNEAYEVLKDPKKRQRYDMLGANYQNGQDFRPPSGFGGGAGFDFGGGHPFGGAGAGAAFSDFFQAIFGGSGGAMGSERAGYGARSASRPQSQELDMEITLEDAYHGATKSIVLERPVNPRVGSLSSSRRNLQVKIPAGTTEGTRIRLAAQAADSGDLLLRVRLRSHPRFRVEGHDLTTKLSVTPWEAVLGTKVLLSTLDGNVTLRIPPGSQAGSQLRLRGKGLTQQSGERGCLLVELQVVVPAEPTEIERNLYEKLRDEGSFEPRS